MKASHARSRGRLAAGHLVVPLGAGACLVPGVPSWAALLGGLALALTVGNPHVARTRRAVPLLLALGVVGLGAGMEQRSCQSRSKQRCG